MSLEEEQWFSPDFLIINYPPRSSGSFKQELYNTFLNKKLGYQHYYTFLVKQIVIIANMVFKQTVPKLLFHNL